MSKGMQQARSTWRILIWNDSEGKIRPDLRIQINRESREVHFMKRTLLALAVFTAGAFLAGDKAYAHHSFAATYFEDQKVTY